MSAVQELRPSEGTVSRFGPSSTAFVDEALASLRIKIDSELREKIASDLRAYLQAEMQSVQVRIEGIEAEISSMMEDFSIPLEKPIKKRLEIAELNAFNKGLQFALDGLNGLNSSTRP